MTRRAFTLIELLLVVMVLAVLAGLNAPLFSKHYEARQLRQAADDVVYLMRYARSRAMIEQVVYQVALREHKVTLFRAVDGLVTDSRGFTGVEGVMGRARNLPSHVTFSGAPDAVLFYPDGMIDRVHFSLRGRKAGFVISTDEVVGHVSIAEEEPGA